MSRDSLVKDQGCATSEGARRHYSSAMPRRWMRMSRVSREETPEKAGPIIAESVSRPDCVGNESSLLPCYLAFRCSKCVFTKSSRAPTPAAEIGGPIDRCDRSKGEAAGWRLRAALPGALQAERRFSSARATPPRISNEAITSRGVTASAIRSTPARAASTGTESCTVAAAVAVSPGRAAYHIA